VREETGVDAEFVSFVGFREKHGYTWGRDDFYYYAYLRPKSHEINIDTEEIEKAQWLDFEVCEIPWLFSKQ
jgi:8-oxo-dGTP pyrophosphatase MutT (NUDIX family)